MYVSNMNKMTTLISNSSNKITDKLEISFSVSSLIISPFPSENYSDNILICTDTTLTYTDNPHLTLRTQGPS